MSCDYLKLVKIGMLIGLGQIKPVKNYPLNNYD